MSRTSLLTAAACAALLLASGPAGAATCSFTTIIGVDFGSYDVFSTSPLDSVGSVALTCTGVGAFDVVTVDLGPGGGASYSPRQLSSGTDSLAYNIYLDAARSVVWGDDTSGTSHYGPVTPPEGTEVDITAYGRIPAGQDVSAGSYGDSLIVTLNY